MHWIAGVYTDLAEQQPVFQNLIGKDEVQNLLIKYKWLGTPSDLRQQILPGQARSFKVLLKKVQIILIQRHRDLENVTVILERIKELAPDMPVIQIGSLPNAATFIEWLEAGLDGYLLESCPIWDLDKAVFHLIKDQTPAFSSELLIPLIDGVRLRGRKVVDKEKKMSVIQRDICSLLLKGNSYLEIAETLGIKLDKVRYHIKRIYIKHGVTKSTQLFSLLRGA